ncbi:MAG: GGDEF domain-containing protein [Moraxellaceae bacterium]|nr:GGDEF domain-containing protein [Moraxellaceae bacterium]
MTWLQQLRTRGNPIDWHATDRAIFVVGINIVLFIFFALISLTALLVPAMRDASNPAALKFSLLFSLGTVLFWSAYCALLVRVRQRQPDAQWPSALLIYLIGQPLMVMATLNGMHAIVTGLMLASLPVIGFILFNKRHVMAAVSLIWLEIVVLSVAVNMGYLPDAPLYVKNDYSDSYSLMWLVVQVLIGVPTIAVVMLIVNSLINGLLSREEKILELSRRDGLTGVWNRRYLNELMTHDFAVARRSQTPLAVLMIDLDHFKHINDAHGHQAGDLVLKAAARTLQDGLREIDHIGRYGGEEFLVLLPFCDADTAMIIAERCRRAIANLKAEHNGQIVPVTTSIGVSAMAASAPVASIDALSAAADKALYEAKSAGRNRIVFGTAH